MSLAHGTYLNRGTSASYINKVKVTLLKCQHSVLNYTILISTFFSVQNFPQRPIFNWSLAKELIYEPVVFNANLPFLVVLNHSVVYPWRRSICLLVRQLLGISEWLGFSQFELVRITYQFSYSA